MSTDSLATALAAIGLPGRVEARGGLAIFTAANGASFDAISRDSALCARATALATQHGFALLGLELPPAPDTGATVSGD